MPVAALLRAAIWSAIVVPVTRHRHIQRTTSVRSRDQQANFTAGAQLVEAARLQPGFEKARPRGIHQIVQAEEVREAAPADRGRVGVALQRRQTIGRVGGGDGQPPIGEAGRRIACKGGVKLRDERSNTCGAPTPLTVKPPAPTVISTELTSTPSDVTTAI